MTLTGLGLAALIGGSLGFFGGGGSILTVPLLIYVFGLGPREAIASSLFIVGVTSLFGAYQHARKGNVDVNAAVSFGGAGMIGAYAGGRVGAQTSDSLLLFLFALAMFVTALAMWRGRKVPATDLRPRCAPRWLIVQGLAVGAFTGLVGAGGGFLIVPALALFARVPMKTAIGTSLVVIAMNTASGFWGYIGRVALDPMIVASVTVVAIAGSLTGVRLAERVAPESLRRSFAAFVLVMASAIFVREGSAWLTAIGDPFPDTGGQMLFLVLIFALGALVGRTANGPSSRSSGLEAYGQGAGI